MSDIGDVPANLCRPRSREHVEIDTRIGAIDPASTSGLPRGHRCLNPRGLAGMLSRFFWITRVSGLSKYATDDRGQKDQHSGQKQSGNNLFSQRNAALSSRSATLPARI
jgi:hypothetical protein